MRKTFMPIWKGIPLLTLLLFLSAKLCSQDPFPDPGPVFRDDVLPRIDISIAEDALEELFDPQNAESDYHHIATFYFDNGEYRDTVENIGFRLRGNTSRNSQKKSFKISFNTYVDGGDWNGLEKLNINGEHNDPSVMRSKICWDLLRNFGVPAPRSNHVKLYINGDYYGIYINVEHIDEEFAESRFGNKNGNLYKCLWPADLTYRGEDPDNYKQMAGDRRVYDLRTNEEEDDYSDIAHFIAVLNNTPTEQLACELDKVLNVDGMIRSMAFDILSGNWDGPLFNKNNFYLYRNTATGKFEYIPYDLDNTLGIDWFNIDWATRNIYNWGKSDEPRPLFYKLLSHPDHREKLTYYLDKFLEEYYNENELFPNINRLKAMISNAVIDDPFYPLDYGFDYDDFVSSFDQALSQNHVKDGVKPFITTRRNTTLNQLDEADYAPVITEVNYRLDFTLSAIVVEGRIEDADDFQFTQLCYTHNASPYVCIAMKDDGALPDKWWNDGVFSAAIPLEDFSGNYGFYLKAMDIPGNLSRVPVCEDYSYQFGDASFTLKINEFMADNESVIADNAGEYDDWVELYNQGSEAVFLGDKYITDDSDNPTKWKLPNWMLEPGEFVLFWADDDEEDQGEDHLSFKLSKDGEFIGIYDNIEGELTLLDGLEFGQQQEDISLGRFPNGSGPFGFMSPTPGASNHPLAIEEVPDESLRVFPNPVSGFLYINSDLHFDHWEITDARGRSIKKGGKLYKSLNINYLIPGLYFLKLSNNEREWVKKVVVR
jgi:spore coat protein H